VSTGSFDAGWLALREPIDHRSRARELDELLQNWWGRSRSTRIVDLGAGTGSNLRYLRPVLKGKQAWRVVDHDVGLLERIVPPDPAVTVEAVVGNLAETGLEDLPEVGLVTASALLDLVSQRWLDGLVHSCVRAGCAVLFALSYDGTIGWRNGGDERYGEGDADDRLVRDLVNTHQRRDKGLGPALGPAASTVAETAFRTRGYRTWSAASPWRLGPTDVEVIAALVAGWARAANEQRPDLESIIARWQRRRERQVLAGEIELEVGHADLLALPRDVVAPPYPH
jgi:hypothetical protein